MTSLLLSLLLAPASPIVTPEPTRWKSVAIVGGGFVSGIVFHPKQRGLAYCRTDIGGAYRRDPGSRTWVPLNDWITRPDWNLYGIESIGIDPSDPRRLYLASGTYTNNWGGNGAILRSTDQGRTFQRTDLPFKLGGNEDGRSIGERLAVDPKDGRNVYFGTRHNGLWRSTDFGKTWAQVARFPITGRTNGIGVGFEIFDPSSRAIYVGVASTDINLYRSDDGGTNWRAVEGQPKGLMPHHAGWGADGSLVLTYSNGPGPNGATDGAVWRYQPKVNTWADITPVRPAGEDRFGYAGLSVDASQPNRIVVSTLDRWKVHDEAFVTEDGGRTWGTLREKSVRDSSASPFLNWDRPAPEFGHWMGDIEIDPFDPKHLMYGTGATIWESFDVTRGGEPSHWTVGAVGVEETATIDLMSPPVGAPLVSGLGDIGGFNHFDLDRPVPAMRTNPLLSNTDCLDFAANRPEVQVRVGRGKPLLSGGYSTDAGKTWQPFPSEPAGMRGSSSIAISADGKTIIWAPQGNVPALSTDFGRNWLGCDGIASRGRIIADRVDSQRFVFVPQGGDHVFVSVDGGRSFRRGGTIPTEHGAIRAVPGQSGHYLLPSRTGLFRSTDGAQSFAAMPNVADVKAVGFGRAAPGRRNPTIFMIGVIDGYNGALRSDDDGATWRYLNDAQHAYGTMELITGDPRRYGRVYLGTNGRGVLYGDPARP